MIRIFLVDVEYATIEYKDEVFKHITSHGQKQEVNEKKCVSWPSSGPEFRVIWLW